MGRLFWKIFFIIWLGHVTAVWGISAFSAWLLERDATPAGTVRLGSVPSPQEAFGPNQKPPLAPQFVLPLVLEAAGLLQQHGPQVLQQQASVAGPQEVYVVDMQGRELFGREVPQQELARLRMIKQRDPNMPFLQLVLYQGVEYAVFVPRGSPAPQPHSLAPPAVNAPIEVNPSFAVLEHHLWQPWPMLILTVVSLLYAVLLAWYLSKPIRKLHESFALVAAGNFNVSVSEQMGSRRDELADLGRDFDGVTERLRNVLQSQRRLLHDISHELRSPLARLQVAIGLARQQPAKLESSLSRIELESSRIDKLIGELLTLSKLEADNKILSQQPVSVDELLAEIVSDASFEAKGQNKQVQLVGRTNATIPGSAELLARAFENIVRNALKHTPEESLVAVELQHLGNTVQITISDEGSGVAPNELPLIFEPFFRSHNQSVRTGYGLGLAITRQILLNHGGQICARNRTTGGLAVEVTLPA